MKMTIIYYCSPSDEHSQGTEIFTSHQMVRTYTYPHVSTPFLVQHYQFTNILTCSSEKANLVNYHLQIKTRIQTEPNSNEVCETYQRNCCAMFVISLPGPLCRNSILQISPGLSSMLIMYHQQVKEALVESPV